MGPSPSPLSTLPPSTPTPPPSPPPPLLTAEISEKQARSIDYQLPIAKLPLAKNIDDFQFDGTPFDKTVVNDLAGGGFIAQQRNSLWPAAPVPARLLPAPGCWRRRHGVVV